MTCCTAARVDFCASRNGTFSQLIRLRVDGELLDLTDFTAAMDLRDAPGDDTAHLSLSMTATANGSGIAFVDDDPTSGELLITITNADILELPEADDTSEARAFAYDLVLTNEAGDPNPYLEGVFSIQPGVTQ
jgi:hypothetical protein